MRAALRLKSSTVPRRFLFQDWALPDKNLTAALFHLTYPGSFLYTPASLFVYLNVLEVRGAAKLWSSAGTWALGKSSHKEMLFF